MYFLIYYSLKYAIIRRYTAWATDRVAQ
jgi:hypothetical protein